MKSTKLSIATLFLTSTFTLLYGQTDSVKNEKKLEGVLLRGSAKKASESSILNFQKKSVETIERIGSVQLQKQGIGDVASAVTKATGTQKQESSGQIIIRGLGDRYNSTTLNGLPIPSENPEFKNINLELFKTSVVEYISLDKVYNPKLSGDFGGAAIGIVSKEHSGKPYFKVGLGSSINLQTFDKTNFKLQDGAPGFFGYKKTTFRKSNPQEIYPFQSSWNFKNAANPFSSSMDFEFGTSIGKLAVFGYAGFDNSYIYSNGEEGFYDASGDAIKKMTVERYSYGTNTTALLNLSYKINNSNKIGFTTNFIHSSEQEARFIKGYMREIGTDVLINRADNKLTSTWINQLYGNHKVGSWTLDWGGSFNQMNSDRPDRMQNTFDAETNYLLAGSTVNNHRYFDALEDRTLNGNLSISKQFEKAKVLFGYSGSFKDRSFKNTTIGLNFSIQTAVDPNNVDSFINPSNNGIISYNTFRSDAERFVPFFYKFKQDLNSGFLNLDYSLTEKVIVQLGARLDNVSIKSNWDDSIFGKDKKDKTYLKFLPALNVKYSLNDKNNLRFAASKTYTLPQAKELVPVGYYDVTTNVYGNQYLNPSDNYNLDLKWEFFPSQGELISLTTFGKYIQNPIARTTYSTASSSDMTYFNIANWGTILGAELEIRKDIAKWNSSKLYTFLNATYMHSEQKLKSETEFAAENGGKTIQFNGQEKDDVQGVANFLANVNLAYNVKFSSENTLDFVLGYAYVGKSLFALGTNNVGNFYENPIHLLDATLNFQLKQVGIGLQAKNLINSDNKIEQTIQNKDYTHKSYTRGCEVGLHLSYKF